MSNLFDERWRAAVRRLRMLPASRSDHVDYNSTSNLIDDGDCSVHVGEDGTWYCHGRLVQSAATNQNAVFMVSSSLGGDRLTWKYVGNGTNADTAHTVYTGDAATYLRDFVGVSHRGRQVLIGLSESDVTSSTTLSATFLGGPTTVTLPGKIAYPAPYQRSGWTESYLPFELPANISSLTTAGVGTDTIDADGLLNRSTSGNTKTSTSAAPRPSHRASSSAWASPSSPVAVSPQTTSF